MQNTLIVIVVLIIIAVGAFLFLSGDGGEAVVEEASVPTALELTIRNVSEGQPLSPGVIVVHDERFSANYEGELAPSDLEPLAEYGSNSGYLAFVEGQEGVLEVVNIDAPIVPGAARTFNIEAEEGALVSIVQMLVATNDGVALVDAQPLFADGSARTFVVLAQNYDNGTEENEEPEGGFDAGQPDPTRGEENVENGTPTDPQEPVALHDQITDAVLELSVASQPQS